MADEIVVRGSELGAVAAFLDRGAGRLAALVVEGEAGIGKSTVWEAALEAAASRGWLVRTSRPARSEQGLTLGGLTDLFGDVDDETLARLPAPQRQALGVALLRIEATARVAGSAHPVRRGRRPAETPRRGSAGPDRDRRCPVARREHRRDPRLRAAAARRPAGRAARDRAHRRRDAGIGRAPGRRPAGPAGTRRARADAPRGAPSAVPGPARAVVPTPRAGADRGGVGRQPALCAGARPRAAPGRDPGRRPRDAPRARQPGLAHRRPRVAAPGADPTRDAPRGGRRGAHGRDAGAGESRDRGRPAAGGRGPARGHRGRRRPVRPPAVRAVGAEPRAGGRASVGARSPVRGDAVRGRPGTPSRARGGRPGRDRRGDPRTGRRARPQPRRDPRRREPLPGGEPPDALGRSRWPRSTEPASPPSACSSTCPSTSRPTGSSRRRSIGPRQAPRAPTRSACARSSATTTGACPRRSSWASRHSRRPATPPGSARRCSGGSGTS